MPDYPDFPALACNIKLLPALDYEDDTLASEQESGLVITRPRGSKTRRTWTVDLLPFGPEDFDLLDIFIRQTVRGAAGMFYFNIPDRDPDRIERVLVRFAKGKVPQPRFAGMGRLRADRSAIILRTASFAIQEV